MTDTDYYVYTIVCFECAMALLTLGLGVYFINNKNTQK